MTFKANELENISLNLNGEWIVEDDNTVTVMFFGLEKYLCKMFDIDLDDEFPDGWIDSYAFINPIHKTVKELYFLFVSNAGGENDRELNIKITNNIEARMIYDALKTKELDEFLDNVEFEEV